MQGNARWFPKLKFLYIFKVNGCSVYKSLIAPLNKKKLKQKFILRVNELFEI